MDIAYYIFSFLLCLIIYKKSLLTLSGSIMAFLMSIIFYLIKNFLFITLILVFFVSSSIFTKFKKENKKDVKEIHKKNDHKRDVVQVLANGLIPVIMAILFIITKDTLYIVLYSLAVAASTADTWASEIGVLSKAKPRSIITGKLNTKGLSGAVTPLGIFSSFLGALLIALIYLLFNINVINHDILINASIIVCGGFLSSLIDSILGDTIQVKYIDNYTSKITEKPKTNNIKNKKIKGIIFFNNDVVNFISPIIVIMIILFCYYL